MDLSDFEYQVMCHFWHDTPQTAPEIHKIIAATHPVSYSTVKTIIDRLEAKGALTRVKQQGRTIFYAPTISEKAVKKPLIKSFLKKVFSDKPTELFSHLLEEEMSIDDIRYLESLIKKKKSELKK